ncbi:putative protein kinase RLK-Pelle-DLSV family [Helianthus annuus]|nr:putative protein kinase RLK-Pelle-DLSV family [Helianthus annuus]
MNEASILVKVEHQNLMQLLGYCIHGTKVYLIYDFALNATLADMIYDPMCNLLDWDKRYKILLGVARTLVYLHRHAPIRIIHLDVQPANILIDESYNPRLSGFEVAVTTSETDCVSLDNVFGTVGYIAPEYHMTLRCSTKADVYSFGMLVFKTITGKSIWNLSPLRPVEYVHKNWLEGTLSDIIDPRIDVDPVSMTKCAEIGLLCVQRLAADRPTMEEVIGMLLGTSPLTRKLARIIVKWRKSPKWPILGIPESMTEHHEAPDSLKGHSEVRINMLTLLTLRRTNFQTITQTTPLIQQVAYLRIRTPCKVIQRLSLSMLTLLVPPHS